MSLLRSFDLAFQFSELSICCMEIYFFFCLSRAYFRFRFLQNGKEVGVLNYPNDTFLAPFRSLFRVN